MTRRTLIAAVAAIALAGAIGGVAVDRVFLHRPTLASSPEDKAAETAPDKPSDTVSLNAAQIQAAGIETATAVPGALSAAIIAQASVAASPGGEAVLAARADGAVTRILKQLGDPVAAGQTIALIESRDASTIAAERSTAAARASAARAAYAREKRLYEARITARQDLEAAQADLATAEAELGRASAAGAAARVSSDGRSLAVVSPISGRLTAAPAVLGAFVTAGTELFRVADPRRIDIRAAVPAADAQRVAPGDRARIETPDGTTLSAVVRSITPGVDSASRAATVVLTLTGGPGALRPGGAVRVQITPKVAAASGRVVLPEDALQSIAGRDGVFVRTAQGFRFQPVTVAARGAGQVEIAAGLAPGAAVAVRNAFRLKGELTKSAADESE